MNDLPQDADNQEVSSELREFKPPRILSNRGRDIFLALLDADHEPNEALKAAAERYRQGYYVGDVYHFSAPRPDAEADDKLDS